MAKVARNQAVAIVAAVLTTAPAAAQSIAEATIDVRVYNYADLPATDIAAACRAAAHIYAQAGVWFRWQDSGTLPVSLVLLSHERTEAKAVAENIPGGVLGRGAATTGRAYAFSGRVATVAARTGSDPVALLGTVIAHELGHVLLGTAGHAADGIMRADLNPRAKAGSFTEAQAARLRAVVASGSVLLWRRALAGPCCSGL
jgi:hypothetical protein